MYLDIGNDIQDNRYERKTLGKFTFREAVLLQKSLWGYAILRNSTFITVFLR